MSINNFKLSNRAKNIAIAIVGFLVITFVYFSPQLKGYVLNGSDTVHFRGMSKEISDYKKETGESSLWSNSMFGGMPTFLSGANYEGELVRKVSNIYYKIPRPASYLILNFSLFFVLLLLLGTNVWISFVGALAFGMNTAFFVWMDSGHMTKANSITFIALAVSGVLMAYNKSRWKGGVIAAMGIALMLNANHPQVTYYAGLMIIIIVITYLIDGLRKKTFVNFFKSSLVLLFAAILGFGTSYGRLATTLEYGKYSIRGKSNLEHVDNENKTAGLDKSYILEYSYDFGEAVSAFIPRFKGGGMAEPLGDNSNFFKELKKTQGVKRAKDIAAHAPLYWGSQPIAGAPFYYGAVLVFLFAFGLFLVKGKEKWWIVATVIFAFLLSLGKNIPALANFMIDYFPGYNKFRDVKNIIIIQHFAMALMGVLGIQKIVSGEIEQKQFLKALKYAGGIVGGFALLFAVLPGLAGDFASNSDAQYLQMGWPNSLVNALRADRKAVLRADALRSFVFVGIAAVTLYFFFMKKLKGMYALIIWGALVMIDMWPVNTKYLNNDDFVSKRKAENPFTASKADQYILNDKSLDYRVLNISVNPWSDASTSYFHKSVGGYHGAKMERYQELIEYQLSPEIQQIQMRLRNVKTQEDVDAVFAGMNALNMLNAKYVIYNPNAAPLVNNSAMGNAWFVDSIKVVKSANEEIEFIDDIDVSKIALVHKEFESSINKGLINNSSAQITLKKYAPNKLIYQTKAVTEKLAVFSEVYYPRGWKATIDGQDAEILRVNHVLRAMVVPAGEHEIVFSFEPSTYESGNKVSLASSLLLLLSILGLVFFEIKGKIKKE